MFSSIRLLYPESLFFKGLNLYVLVIDFNVSLPFL